MIMNIEFVTQACIYSGCGITWAQPKDFDDKRRNDHKAFFCPNGHSQYYSGKSELELARHELAQTNERLFIIENCAEHKKNRIRSLKGVITKMKKRIK